MGNPRLFIGKNGFTKYTYIDCENWKPVTINGITAKVIRKITDINGRHTGLPRGAGDSDMYFCLDNKGQVKQGRLYKNRLLVADFDWGHEHTNDPTKGGNAETFPKGTVHVQEFKQITRDGAIRTSENARLMTDEEISKYGQIILHFNPNVRFR
jgi:hypothetical protein